ncbi:hypothetical protein NC651_036646 [Populus alba x Populus x berolinensis]|nr:hypothetical protein NC651_036646 [Populus alba x Populus x berolinensis]
MSKLPQDIINDVLTYLPFKCVWKLWRSSISDLKFVKSHLKRAKEVNSSCHRLLLSTRTPQSVDFEAASGGDEDNAVQELEYPEAIRCSPAFFIGNSGIFQWNNLLIC